MTLILAVFLPYFYPILAGVFLQAMTDFFNSCHFCQGGPFYLKL